jgi:hypothetical protein
MTCVNDYSYIAAASIAAAGVALAGHYVFNYIRNNANVNVDAIDPTPESTVGYIYDFDDEGDYEKDVEDDQVDEVLDTMMGVEPTESDVIACGFYDLEDFRDNIAWYILGVARKMTVAKFLTLVGETTDIITINYDLHGNLVKLDLMSLSRILDMVYEYI